MRADLVSAGRVGGLLDRVRQSHAFQDDGCAAPARRAGTPGGARRRATPRPARACAGCSRARRRTGCAPEPDGGGWHAMADGRRYELVRIGLADGGETTVYVVVHPRRSTRLRVVCFEQA